jgi:hypothetical protein
MKTLKLPKHLQNKYKREFFNPKITIVKAMSGLGLDEPTSPPSPPSPPPPPVFKKKPLKYKL